MFYKIDSLNWKLHIIHSKPCEEIIFTKVDSKWKCHLWFPEAIAFIGYQKSYLEVQIQKEGREEKKEIEKQILTNYLKLTRLDH